MSANPGGLACGTGHTAAGPGVRVTVCVASKVETGMVTGVRLAVAVTVGTRVAIIGSLGSLIGVRVGLRVDVAGAGVVISVA